VELPEDVSSIGEYGFCIRLIRKFRMRSDGPTHCSSENSPMQKIIGTVQKQTWIILEQQTPGKPKAHSIHAPFLAIKVYSLSLRHLTVLSAVRAKSNAKRNRIETMADSSTDAPITPGRRCAKPQIHAFHTFVPSPFLSHNPPISQSLNPCMPPRFHPSIHPSTLQSLLVSIPPPFTIKEYQPIILLFLRHFLFLCHEQKGAIRRGHSLHPERVHNEEILHQIYRQAARSPVTCDSDIFKKGRGGEDTILDPAQSNRDENTIVWRPPLQARLCPWLKKGK
jgi:hypothetical protein